MRISVPDRSLALNALGALLAAIEIGASPDEVLDGLAGFEGVRRRFELVGTSGTGQESVRVFDDYAHHPTEIAATLAAVRTLLEQSGGDPSGRCIVVFQPHLYSRTKAFATEFGRALDAAGRGRRARRERAARGAAQERARASEAARRAAKRQASGRIVNQPKPAARGVVRGLRMLLVSVVVAVLGVGLGLVLYFTPAMS